MQAGHWIETEASPGMKLTVDSLPGLEVELGCVGIGYSSLWLFFFWSRVRCRALITVRETRTEGRRLEGCRRV